jgi:hypothetical protein
MEFTLDKSGLGGLAVRHPSIGGESQVQFLVQPDFEPTTMHTINDYGFHSNVAIDDDTLNVPLALDG